MSRRRRPERGGAQAGFTLIEVLAALVVTGLIVAVVLPYASRLATRWWSGQAAIASADAWIQAVTRMSDDLAQAVPLALGPESQPVTAFRAGSDGITFVRPALGRPGALEIVRYAIRPSSAGSALVRLSRPFDAESFGAADAGGASATLLDGKLRFRFAEIAADGQRRSGWAPSDGMPVAVELSVTGERPGDAPAAPIALPITARAPAVAAAPKT